MEQNEEPSELEQLTKRVAALERENAWQHADICLLKLLAATTLAETMKDRRKDPDVRMAFMDGLENRMKISLTDSIALQQYDNAVDELLNVASEIRRLAYRVDTPGHR